MKRSGQPRSVLIIRAILRVHKQKFTNRGSASTRLGSGQSSDESKINGKWIKAFQDASDRSLETQERAVTINTNSAREVLRWLYGGLVRLLDEDTSLNVDLNSKQ